MLYLPFFPFLLVILIWDMLALLSINILSHFLSYIFFFFRCQFRWILIVFFPYFLPNCLNFLWWKDFRMKLILLLRTKIITSLEPCYFIFRSFHFFLILCKLKFQSFQFFSFFIIEFNVFLFDFLSFFSLVCIGRILRREILNIISWVMLWSLLSGVIYIYWLLFGSLSSSIFPLHLELVIFIILIFLRFW